MSSIPRDREKNGGALDFHLPSQHWGGRDMQILGLPGQQASPTSQVQTKKTSILKKQARWMAEQQLKLPSGRPTCVHIQSHTCASAHTDTGEYAYTCMCKNRSGQDFLLVRDR